MNAFSKFLMICRMVKIEHSVFALPFAFSGAILAKGGWPDLKLIFFLTVAMVGVRSFAMAANRALDYEFDRKNPRSANWPLVTGEITVRQTWIFAGVMGAVFIAACAGLNWICLAASPLALAATAFYSLTKRFTWFCHYVLGMVIGLAPVAGWISVSPEFALPPVFLWLAVAFWISGFDIIYSGLDMEFDRSAGLHSMPARLGINSSFNIAAFGHVGMVVFLFLTGLSCGLSWGWYLCLGITALILFNEHRVAKTATPRRLKIAFAMNGPISILLLLGTLMGTYW